MYGRHDSYTENPKLKIQEIPEIVERNKSKYDRERLQRVKV